MVWVILLDQKLKNLTQKYKDLVEKGAKSRCII